jgi:methyl-accepting chemotaxis protein
LRETRRDLRSGQAGKIGFSIFLACLFSGPLVVGVVSNTRKNLEAQSTEIRTLRDKLAQVTVAQQDQKEEIAREVSEVAAAQNSRLKGLESSLGLATAAADQTREAVAEITRMQARLEKVEQQLQEQKLSGEALAQSQTRIRLEIYQLRRAMIALSIAVKS